MHLLSLDVSLQPPMGVRISWLALGLEVGDVARLERAPTTEGPWEQVVEVSAGQGWADDPRMMGADADRRHAWRVIFARGATVLMTTRALEIARVPSKVVASIIESQNTYLYGRDGANPYSGSHLFARYCRDMTDEVCPTCVSEVTGRIFLHDCPACKGARKVGGWYGPQLFRAVFQSPVRTSTQVNIRVNHTDNRVLRMGSWPLLADGDALIDRALGIAWRVTGKSVSEPEGCVVSQLVNVERIPLDHVTSTLPGPDPAQLPGGPGLGS